MENVLKYDKLMHTNISLTKYLADKVHGNAFWLNVLSTNLKQEREEEQGAIKPVRNPKYATF